MIECSILIRIHFSVFIDEFQIEFIVLGVDLSLFREIFIKYDDCLFCVGVTWSGATVEVLGESFGWSTMAAGWKVILLQILSLWDV